jgi:hypothetical protein
VIFVGVDWVEAHHDVHLANGVRLVKARLPKGSRYCQVPRAVGAHVEDPADVVIGIETDSGLFVATFGGGLGAGRLRGLRRQSHVDVALSGPSLELGRQVRRR